MREVEYLFNHIFPAGLAGEERQRWCAPNSSAVISHRFPTTQTTVMHQSSGQQGPLLMQPPLLRRLKMAGYKKHLKVKTYGLMFY